MAGDDSLTQVFKESFNVFDLDHSGFIMIDEELTCDRALMEGMGQEWTAEDEASKRAEWIAQDTNGDGKVSLEEFVAAKRRSVQPYLDQGMTEEQLYELVRMINSQIRDRLQEAGPPPAEGGAWQPVVGSIVVVNGSSATEYNGRQGVCEVFNTELGRWVVALDDGERRGVRPEHLEPGAEMAEWAPLPGFAVTIQGSSAPEANGQAGVIEAFDASQGRWVVILESGEKRGVKAENLFPTSR